MHDPWDLFDVVGVIAGWTTCHVAPDGLVDDVVDSARRARTGLAGRNEGHEFDVFTSP